MAQEETEQQKLKHELGNVQAEKYALQNMLRRASDEIEDLVESDCNEAQKEHSAKAAERFRRAASL